MDELEAGWKDALIDREVSENCGNLDENRGTGFDERCWNEVHGWRFWGRATNNVLNFVVDDWWKWGQRGARKRMVRLRRGGWRNDDFRDDISLNGLYFEVEDRWKGMTESLIFLIRSVRSLLELCSRSLLENNWMVFTGAEEIRYSWEHEKMLLSAVRTHTPHIAIYVDLKLLGWKRRLKSIYLLRFRLEEDADRLKRLGGGLPESQGFNIVWIEFRRRSNGTNFMMSSSD